MGDISYVRNLKCISFKDSYGLSCSIQESSSVTPHIWLGIDNADPKIMASEAKAFGVETDEVVGWVPYPIPKQVSLDTRMHLNKEKAKELIKLLKKFVKTESL